MAYSEFVVLTRRCLHQRRSPQEFSSLVNLVLQKQSYTSTGIVAGLIKATFGFCLENDALVSSYLSVLITSQLVTVSDCLYTLIKYWEGCAKNGSLQKTACANMFAQLIANLAAVQPKALLPPSEARACMILTSRWLHTLLNLASSQEEQHNSDHVTILVPPLSVLLITLLQTSSGNAAIKHVENEKEDILNVVIRQAIQASMSIFPDVSMRLLSEAHKHPALDDTSDADANHAQATEMAAMTFENNIISSQIIPTRTSTYVLLYTKLLQCATIDDPAIINFLDTRHSSDTTAMFNDLLFSSFDALTKPIQSDDPLYQAQCRIYLHNKLPTILSSIANSFQPLATGQYLHELWKELGTISRSETLDVAKHFLHVCVLHHLITADEVQHLTGEAASSTSPKGLFLKEVLVAQVQANASRGPRLIDELLKNDGSAGSFSYAVVEIMHKYCRHKEHQLLKEMSNSLVARPHTINSLAMFVRPADFLGPLCRMLDEWSWNDIHGESQPVYEDFGSIFLLIMTFKFRLHLANDELGMVSRSGFIAHYLSSGQTEKLLSHMKDSERINLGNWIHNLYESEGISDEVTSDCSAQEFYLNLPTLLQQSMTASSRGLLTRDKLEGGLDYLLEPFLVPSLVSAFKWLSRAILKDAKHAMIILRRLVKTPENAETAKLHRTIIDIAAGWFREPIAGKRESVVSAEVLELFGSRAPFSLCEGLRLKKISAKFEQGDNISAYLQQCFAQTRDAQKATRTHAIGLYQPNILLALAELKTPAAMISGMISLLVQNASINDFAHLLDVLATIIDCTPIPGISLRSHLQLLHAKLGHFLKNGETVFAEALIHLSRRVDLYTTALTPQAGSTIQDLSTMADVELADEINLDKIPTKVDAPEPPTQPATQEPEILNDENLEQMLNDAGDMTQTEDYTFNENDMFDLDNYKFEELDMSMF